MRLLSHSVFDIFVAVTEAKTVVGEVRRPRVWTGWGTACNGARTCANNGTSSWFTVGTPGLLLHALEEELSSARLRILCWCTVTVGVYLSGTLTRDKAVELLLYECTSSSSSTFSSIF